MSLKRNLVLLACYFGALVFMSLPFTMIDAEVPPATLAQAQ